MKSKISISILSAAFLLLCISEGNAATFTVNMVGGNRFNPASQTVNVGDTVTWVNQDFTGHDTVSGTAGVPDGVWNSNRLLSRGQSFSFTFNIPPGIYPYYCTPHVSVGMVGTITVLSSANIPPSVSITNPPDHTTFAVGANILVQADASDTDGISRVDFFANGGPIGSASVRPYGATISNAGAGTYALTAVAVDNLGASSTSAVVTVTVQPGNLPPSVTITNPANGDVFFEGTNILVQATASDADGIAQVEFFTNGISAGITTTQPYSVLLNNVAVGPYVLTAIATDTLGTNATSEAVTISVITPLLQPTILSGPRSQTAAIGSNVFFSVSAAGAQPLLYQWQFNSTDIASATTAAFALVNVQTNNAGNYRVIVSNSAGSVTSAVAILTVTLPANVPPQVAITNPPSGTRFPAHANITITAQASDSDGTVLQVEFFVRTNSLRTNSVGIATSRPFSVVLTNLAVGTNFLSAKATDDRGGVTTSVEVVISGHNPPIVLLTLSTTNREIQLGTDILLSATATSVGTRVTNIALFEGSSRLAQNPSNSITFLWRPTESREYLLSAVATDDLGLSGTSATVMIRIFSPVPFSAVAGAYTGVFFDQHTNQLSVENSGLFNLKVNKRGTFAGKLRMNGANYLFRGQLDSFGKINLPVIRRARAPAVLALQLDLSGDTDQIHGTVTTAGVTNALVSDLLADRNVFNSRTNPAPQAGRRSFFLQPAPDLNGEAKGLASAKTTTSGKVQIHGLFNDGRRFTLGTAISKAGNVPFYVSLSHGAEAMVGWLHFGKLNNDVAANPLWQVRSIASQIPTQVEITPVTQ